MCTPSRRCTQNSCSVEWCLPVPLAMFSEQDRLVCLAEHACRQVFRLLMRVLRRHDGEVWGARLLLLCQCLDGGGNTVFSICPICPPPC